jgi:hypothetical protein
MDFVCFQKKMHENQHFWKKNTKYLIGLENRLIEQLR